MGLRGVTEDVGGVRVVRGFDQRGVAGVLTSRQLEMMRLRANGSTFGAIADQMCVSRTTLKRELAAIRSTLGATCDEDVYRDLGWLVVP